MKTLAALLGALVLSTALAASAAEQKGPRIPYPDPATLSPAKRAAIAKTPFNVTRMMVRASDGVFDGLSQFSGAFYTTSKLDPVLREIAILRVGYLSNAPYETFQHEAGARNVKMTEAQIAAVKQGGKHPGVLTEPQQAVMDFTEDVVKNVRASDATLAGVRRHLDDTTVVDLILLIGTYMMVSRLLETTGVELEEAPIDWSNFNTNLKALNAK